MDERSDLECLIAFSELDARKKELDALAAALPAELEKREEDLGARQEELDRLQRVLEETQRERRRLEASVDDKTRLLAKYRAQLESVKTNKEYQSLQNEIKLTREQISGTEDKLLELLEGVEKTRRSIDERLGGLEQLKAEVARANEEARARLKDVEVQLIEVEEKRKRLIPALSRQVRAGYKRLSERYQGGAFAVAADGVCQGCYVNIPAKVVADLRSGAKLYRCESCGRFIFSVVPD
jgi:predicted  nucleic acid-binding Zn-ribbon protein